MVIQLLLGSHQICIIEVQYKLATSCNCQCYAKTAITLIYWVILHGHAVFVLWYLHFTVSNQFSMRTWAAVDVARFMLEVIPSARFTSILRSWVVTPSFKPPHTSHSTRHGALSRGKPISPATMNDNSCNKIVSSYLVLPVQGGHQT